MIRTTRNSGRRAVVLITVLVVLAVLLLVAYQYINLMMAESSAAVVGGRVAQSRHLADSGVHYAAFVLAYPQMANLSESLESYRTWPGSVYDNADVFHGRPVNGADGIKGYFSIVSRRDPLSDPYASTQGYRFGVEDENGKLNVTAVRKLPQDVRETLKTMIKQIPNINEETVDAVFNWTEPGGTTDTAEAGYYSSLGYACKGGPFDTTDELLLVRGWTPKQLYGNDRNRNGRLDPDEEDGTGQVDMGMQRYFTVYSREMNVDSSGQQRVNLNNSDLSALKSQLDAAVGTEMSAFILLGKAVQLDRMDAFPPPLPTNAPAGFAVQDGALVVTDVSRIANPRQIASLWSLVNRVKMIRPAPGQPPITVGPLLTADKEKLRNNLNLLFDKCSLSGDLEIPARININTTPAEILTAIGLSEADVQKLLQYRPSPDMDPATVAYYKTPAWLQTEAEIDMYRLPDAVLRVFDNVFTTYSQVYRFQVVGYYELRGPQVRLEVVVDANNGRPRILHWRDLSDLGKGYNFSSGSGATFVP